MQVTDELVRTVVQEVLGQMRNGKAKPSNGHAQHWGIFGDVNAAVTAASPGVRVSRAVASAANTAVCSWRTSTRRTGWPPRAAAS